MDFERRFICDAAYDKRDSDPRKNYGIHGVQMRWYLIKENRAVQFVLFTGWLLPETAKEMDAKHLDEGIDAQSLRCFYKPMPADLGFHSPVPCYEGHTMLQAECEFTGGGPCYYDGSGLSAESVYEILLREGSEGVWKRLEEYYHEVFENA